MSDVLSFPVAEHCWHPMEQNIRQSFRAFEHDDGRVEDHHEDHYGNDDGQH
jgi:hypothetical protein